MPKFSELKKGVYLTDKRLGLLIKKVSDILNNKELELFKEILFNREEVLIWDWEYIRRIKDSVSLPIEMKVIPYRAWQMPAIYILAGIQGAFIDILREQLGKEILEWVYSLYRNYIVLIAKKTSGKYRLINDYQPVNKIMIRDTFAPLSAKAFAKAALYYIILLLIDLFSRYNQIKLAEKSCNMIAFDSLLGLLYISILSQEAMNAVA